MKIIDVVPRTILIHIELTVDEADAISMALSKCRIDTGTPDEKEAADCLTKFSNMINTLLERVPYASDK